MSVFLFTTPVKAVATLDIYLFYGNTCPHCAKEETFFEDYLPAHPEVNLYKYEVYENSENLTLWQQVGDLLDTEANAVPYLIVGNEVILGYNDSLRNEIEDRIEYCLEYTCPDSVAALVNPNTTPEPTPTKDPEPVPEPTPTTTETKKIVNLPLIGEVDALTYSLPIITILTGLVDGFNPCAMWTLLFLISLLLGMKNRKKMWLLGGAFIFTSAFVYFLFMAAWLNAIMFIGVKLWLRLTVGILAIGGGAYSIKKFFTNKNSGCEITGNEKRRATFEKLKNIVKHNNLWLALGGIVLLAFVVNLVEAVCSAGLPVAYTQVLALNDLASWQYYSYLLLYIFFFMLDDLIIFILAMTTLKLTGISTKYSRISKIVGGIIMVLIGLLLIFKYEWLMFG